jgi:hypothetical protein
MTSSDPMADSAILAIASNAVAGRCGVMLFQTQCCSSRTKRQNPGFEAEGLIGVNAALHECVHGPFPRCN